MKKCLSVKWQTNMASERDVWAPHQTWIVKLKQDRWLVTSEVTIHNYFFPHQHEYFRIAEQWKKEGACQCDSCMRKSIWLVTLLMILSVKVTDKLWHINSPVMMLRLAKILSPKKPFNVSFSFLKCLFGLGLF